MKKATNKWRIFFALIHLPMIWLLIEAFFHFQLISIDWVFGVYAIVFFAPVLIFFSFINKQENQNDSERKFIFWVGLLIAIFWFSYLLKMWLNDEFV